MGFERQLTNHLHAIQPQKSATRLKTMDQRAEKERTTEKSRPQAPQQGHNHPPDATSQKERPPQSEIPHGEQPQPKVLPPHP